jgi:hypothetical protein
MNLARLIFSNTLQRELLALVWVIAAVLMAAVVAPAFAQLGASAVITVPGSVTSDAPTEQNTGIAALSLTAPGGGGTYTSATGTIATLDQGLFSGGNAQNFNTTFSGWLACETDCTAMAQQVIAASLQTFHAVLNDVAHNEARLQNEDFTNISNASQNTMDVAPLLRISIDTQLQILRELQFISHQLDALNTATATADAEKLNESAVTAAQDLWLMLTGLGVQQ